MKQFKHLMCHFINVSLLNSTNSKNAGLSSFLVWCCVVMFLLIFFLVDLSLLIKTYSLINMYLWLDACHLPLLTQVHFEETTEQGL